MRLIGQKIAGFYLDAFYERQLLILSRLGEGILLHVVSKVVQHPSISTPFGLIVQSEKIPKGHCWYLKKDAGCPSLSITEYPVILSSTQ